MAESPWSSSLQKRRLALVPLRRGKRLRKDDSNSKAVSPESTGTNHHHGMIPLWHTQTTTRPSSASLSSLCSSASEVIIVVGRQELLPCLYAACGCHSNIHSTQHKCPDCQQINQWAPYALSRQMLRFAENMAEEEEIQCQEERRVTTTKPPRMSLQVRGVHACVSVKNNPSDTAGGAPQGCSRPTKSTKEKEEEDSTIRRYSCPLPMEQSKPPSPSWIQSEAILVSQGMRLCLTPTKGDGSLEFEIVLVDPSTMAIVDDKKPSSGTKLGAIPPMATRKKHPLPIPSTFGVNVKDVDQNNLQTTPPNRVSLGDSSSSENDHDDDAWGRPLSQPWSQPQPICNDDHFKGLGPRSKIEEPGSTISGPVVPILPALAEHGSNNNNSNNASKLKANQASFPSKSLICAKGKVDHDKGQTQKQSSCELEMGTFKNADLSAVATETSSHNAILEPMSGLQAYRADGIVVTAALPSASGPFAAHIVPKQQPQPAQDSSKVLLSTTPPSESIACRITAAMEPMPSLTDDWKVSAPSDLVAGQSSNVTMEPKETQRRISTKRSVSTFDVGAAESVDIAIVNPKHLGPPCNRTSNVSRAPASSNSAGGIYVGPKRLPSKKRTSRSLAFTISSEKSDIIEPRRQAISVAVTSQNTSSLVATPTFLLYFCPLGQDLPRQRRAVLANKAEMLGASVVTEFQRATHIVISEHVTGLEPVAEVFRIPVDKLKEYLDQKDVRLVVPGWIANAGSILDAPSMLESWFGYVPKKRAAGDINSGTTQKKPRVSEVKVLTVPSGARNVELSELFKKLSKLHQTCPLLPVDQWKSYCFSVTSGRLRNLSFEVTNDPRVLQRLKSIRGFGTGTMDKIDEFLETGDISRIMEFETDPKRIAMKKMMDIWGVGRVKAMELVLAGYRDIGQVRAKIVEHKLTLDRNQLVGVECYEDILEEMGRDEVEAIGRIVEQTVQQIYPGADLEIMGSYRRGNKGCGDVDVHITHHKFRKKVPEEALGKVADELWRKGHIAFHLTFLPGMQTGRLPHDFHASSRFVPAAAWEASKQASCKWKGTSNGFSSATYFGVFRSPVFKEKRRRVDIKLYPHRETPFASLYFTGNGYFNRSMRLWASRMSYILNDHGLFQRGTNKRVMEASSEKEVFEKLELEYKAPEERDCFDAVVPLKNTPRAELQMKESDFYKDNEHVWIN